VKSLLLILAAIGVTLALAPLAGAHASLAGWASAPNQTFRSFSTNAPIVDRTLTRAETDALNRLSSRSVLRYYWIGGLDLSVTYWKRFPGTQTPSPSIHSRLPRNHSRLPQTSPFVL
jgi:hypothetical protein